MTQVIITMLLSLLLGYLAGRYIRPTPPPLPPSIPIPRQVVSRPRSEEVVAPTASQTAREAVRDAASRLNKSVNLFKLPNSKRNTLQPSTHSGNTSGKVVAAGVIENPSRMSKGSGKIVKRVGDPYSDPKKEVPVSPAVTVEPGFEHKFYGTQLMVNGARIVSGLSNGLHLLEIVQEQMYVDGKIYPTNAGDLEKIQKIIEGARE